MAEADRHGAERDAQDTEELLYTDLDDNSSAFGLDSPAVRLDHCDLLLDAIDAQLGQLQVQPQKHQVLSRELGCIDAAPLRWSHSLSKDTGFGSTTQTNDTPMSCVDLIHTLTVGQRSDKSTGRWEDPVTHEETQNKSDRRTRDNESRREQVIWRLEKLLGDTCNEGRMAGEAHFSSDSICTEDFVRRFRDEMVELTLPENNMQPPDKEGEAERTGISDCDTCQSEHKEQRVLNGDGGGKATTWQSGEVTAMAPDYQSNKPFQREGTERCLSDSYGLNAACCDKAGAEERSSTPQGLGEDESISRRNEVVTQHETLWQNNSSTPKARCLAGVPVWSFDTVSIDTDLDSVSSEQVRQHIRRRPGWRALIQSVTDMDESGTNQSDCDTLTQEESEPRSTSDQRSSCKAQSRSPSRKGQRRESYRLVCSLGDNAKDTDEELNHCSRRRRPERTREKIQSHWVKMKKHLSLLQQKCEKEEETLKLKKTQLKDVELSLSELQQRRKHALQELEQLPVATAMEKEKGTLEFIQRDRRMEKDSISCQHHKLQQQRESWRFQPGVVMSVLEREEMDRQLESAKTELFTEQRRAREKLESMQEKLEETHEELQRVTEAETLLRRRCASLEEKQKQKVDQIKVVEFQVDKLQGELGESKVRVETLEKMLAQKELRLLDLQEKHGALQEERDGLKGELHHLKIQHCSALEGAQDQAHSMKEAALKQQKKDLTLAHQLQLQTIDKRSEEEKAKALKEQALSHTRHIKSLQRSIQLAEEEAKKIKDSLEHQQQEAKKREEELQTEALEKLQEAVEAERRKWEAEGVQAVQVHRGILEEQNRERLESMRSEMQQEKTKALALQHKVDELKTRIQELENESCVQQREQESLMAVICKSLKEEQQAKLQKLQRQMAQESQKAVMRLEQALQLAEKEADRLRVVMDERESSHSRTQTEMDEQLQHWTQGLEAECQLLQLLVEQGGAKQSSTQLPPCPTAAQALANLRALTEQLKRVMSQLHQELDSQKQTTEHLRNDTERELSIQRQQLRMERDRALNSLKERLIQEHIEELSSLNWAHVCDGGASGGLAASLRKQLKAKDLELRQVQRSMGQWKEQTAARLACKFEEQLTAELERKTSKAQEERQRQAERPEGVTVLSVKEPRGSVCSPSHSPSDVASFKLLRYLQSRVKQLRVENQACTWSPSASLTVPADLSGSYVATISQGQDKAGIQSHSSVRTDSRT